VSGATSGTIETSEVGVVVERQAIAAPAVLAGTLLALFLAAMDSTIIGTVLPEIKRSLPGIEHYPWVVSGFILATVLVAPLAGRAADLFGTRKMFLAFVAIFLVGSLGAGVVRTMLELVAARCVQGLGAGGITVLAYVTFAQIFTAEKRAKMQGLLSGVWGIAAILGPAVSSLITRQWGWQWVFYINVPLGIAAAVMLRNVPAGGGQKNEARHLDLFGLALVSASILSGLLLVMMPAGKVDVVWTAGLAVVAVVSVALFVRHLGRHPHDSVLDIAFFTNAGLRAQSIVVVASALIMYTSVTLVPQFLQEVRGESVVQSGLVVMFAAIGWVLGAGVGGQALAKLGFKKLNALGLVGLGVGAALLTVLDKQSTLLIGYLSQALIGAGIGQISIASLLLAQQSLPPARVGVATANVQLLRNVGAVFGVNVFAALAMHGLAGGGTTTAQVAATAAGYQRSFIGMVAVAVLSIPWLLAIPSTTASAQAPVALGD
jgi:EmrB/QacA subfamily drug resistance transporter